MFSGQCMFQFVSYNLLCSLAKPLHTEIQQFCTLNQPLASKPVPPFRETEFDSPKPTPSNLAQNKTKRRGKYSSITKEHRGRIFHGPLIFSVHSSSTWNLWPITFIRNALSPLVARDAGDNLGLNRTAGLSFDVVLSRVYRYHREDAMRISIPVLHTARHRDTWGLPRGGNLMFAKRCFRWGAPRMRRVSHMVHVFDKSAPVQASRRGCKSPCTV